MGFEISSAAVISRESLRQFDKAKRWLQVNALGVFIYLLAASQIWGGQNHLGLGAGDPIVWMLTAFPVLIVFAIINIVWLLWIFWKLWHDRSDWQQCLIWLFGIVVWAAAYRFDWLME